MNQANQKVVVQTANMTLISIRSAEISYFSTFFSSFGTQSALMIGFICGSISQVPGIDNPSDCNYFWIVLYWITSAITVAAAVHVLVCTIFISVYGQGLALRGPLGSMVRAVEGMVVEQQQVLFSFIVTIVAFAFQAVGMYWIMMDSTSAIASTVITFLGMYGWYHYTLRIYNRFSWTDLKADYHNEEDQDAEFDDLDPSAARPPSGRAQVTKTDSNGLKAGLLQSDGGGKNKGLSKFMPGLSKGHSSNTHETATVVSQAMNPMDGAAQRDDDVASRADTAFHDITPSVVSAAQQPAGGGPAERVYGGFITLKTARTFTTDPWERNYLVVRGTLLFYYKDKRAYQTNPQKPINRRPIDLEGYTLVAGAVEPPYAISLIPVDADDIRKAWKFRCDTLAEFNNWIETFSAALKLCESTHSQSDLVVLNTGSVAGGTAARPLDMQSVIASTVYDQR